MTTEYVLAYARGLMRQMGYGTNYLLDFRELKLRDNEKITINAARQIYFLLDGFSDQIRVESENGIYDRLDNRLNENQHQHKGKIIFNNRDSNTLHVQVIVLTPQAMRKKSNR